MRKSVEQLRSSWKRKPQSTKKTVRQSASPKPLVSWFAGAAVLVAAFMIGHQMVEMRQRLDMLQGEVDRMSDMAGHAKAGAVSLKHELARANDERRRLQGQLVAATSRIKQLSDDIEVAEAALDKRRTRLAGAQSKVESAAQTAEKAQEQAASVDQQVASLKTEIDESSAKRNGLREKVESSQSDVERLRAQLEASQSQISRMHDQLTNVESALQGSKHTADQAAAEATALKDQTAALKSELEAGKAERDALREKLVQATAYIQMLKDTSLGASPLVPQKDEAALGMICRARDFLIRTIVFEGSGETEIGKVAIAYVVVNRKTSGRWGDSIEDVVTSPWQFEPWMTRRKAMKKLNTNDPRYRDAARIADAVLMGAVPDPTAGATHFLNPVIVRKRRGGTLPAWASGKGQPIGRHVFYAPANDPGALQQSDAGRIKPTALYHHASQVAGSG